MLITYLRSSSYGSYDFCQRKYWLSYVLGFPDRPHNLKADKGNATHKALELLARKKLAQQRGETVFSSEEPVGTHVVSSFTPDDALDIGWNYYTKVRAPHWDWTSADYRDCKKWMHAALEYNDGMFSPLKRTVLQPEQYFDFIVEADWAKYRHRNPFGDDPQYIEGHLGLKGTVDLVCAVDNCEDVVEYIDWKTGARKCWVTGTMKDYGKLRDDPQLRLYHYALSRLYPKARSIIMTIFFLADGGPFSLPFSREDLAVTEQMLAKRLRDISENELPKRIKPNFRCGWCFYEKSKFVHPDGREDEKNICDYMHGELLQLGLNRCTGKYGSMKAVGTYSEGGGRTNRDSDKE